MPSYTVAYYVAYSLEWRDSLRLNSTLHALPTTTPTTTIETQQICINLRNTLWQNWGGHDLSTPVHPVATPPFNVAHSNV